MVELNQQYIDYKELLLEDYIQKYYLEIQKESNNLWHSRGITHSQFINVLNGENLADINFPPPRGVGIQEVKEFIALNTSKGVFPKDIIDFIGFLMYSGFFLFYRITFEEWINRKDWRHPGWRNSDKPNIYDDRYTILEMISKKGGDVFLRVKIRQLVYWSIPGAW